MESRPRIRQLEEGFNYFKQSYIQDRRNARRNQLNRDAEMENRVLELEVLVTCLQDIIKQQREEIAELKKHLTEELGFSKEYLNKW